MNALNFHAYFIIVLLLFLSGSCQNPNQQTNLDLSDIDLLRGDLITCGGNLFGDVNFVSSCKNSVRESFNLAMSLLHSFEYDEAEKAFVKVIDADPECAMAYWGVAMSIYHTLWAEPGPAKMRKGAKILAIAKTLNTTTREREYLSAIGLFYKDWQTVSTMTREQWMADKMKDIYSQYSNDPEAAILYALALNATAKPTDILYSNQRKAGEILESIFPNQPNHPGVAHYLIHSYDNPVFAPKALDVARQYSEIAPSSAHAQHMPSHIFTRLGLWDESISSNIQSTSSALCYAEAAGLDAHWDEELHGMDYLVYAYLQQGNNLKALEQNVYLNSMDKVFPENFTDAYAIAAIPARIALENKNWESAAQLRLSSINFPWKEYPWQRSILHFSRALGACHLGDLNQADREIAILDSLHQHLVDKDVQYQANQVKIQIKTASAWLSYARGNNEQAISLMHEAANMEDKTTKHPVTPGEVLPARELLGDLYVALNQPVQALEAYAIDRQNRPGRFNGMYGSAVAAQMSGQAEKAKSYFQQLISMDISGDSPRTELEVAKKYLRRI